MKKLFFVIVFIMLGITMFGCTKSEYGYFFHFSVAEGEGELNIQTSDSFNPTIGRCNDLSMCELGCGENSYFISLLGGKEGGREVTFIAIPKEGYKVKEWTFNGKVVEGNNTNTYTAKVTNKDNYNGIIIVKFEKI